MIPSRRRYPALALAALLASSALLTGCTPAKPTTQDAEAAAACVVAHAGPDRLRAMGEAYALKQTSGLARTDAWECGAARWPVALSSAYREGIEPAMVAALTRSPVAREGMYAATFGTLFSARQRVVIGKLGSFFDDARRATLQSLSCGTVEAQAAQVVGRLDLPFAIAVLGIQGDIGDPGVAQNAAEKLLARVNLMMPAQPEASCAKDDGKARFVDYAQQLQQFYQARHPWAPGCGVRADGQDMKLVCTGVKATAKP
jgi:hypothetical protein